MVQREIAHFIVIGIALKVCIYTNRKKEEKWNVRNEKSDQQ